MLTHAQARATIVSKIDHVFFVVFIKLFDVNLRRNQYRLFRGITTTRIGIKCPDKLDLVQQGVDLDTDLLRQMRQLVLLKLVKMVVDQSRSQSISFTPNFKLD